MPTREDAERGGAAAYRTIRVGQGRSRRYLRVAIVRKQGPRGGRTVAGRPRQYKERPPDGTIPR
jgi:hypothetical protein